MPQPVQKKLQRLHSETLLYREEEEVSSCAGIIYTTILLHSKLKKIRPLTVYYAESHHEINKMRLAG